jgi:hypothetical protein
MLHMLRGIFRDFSHVEYSIHDNRKALKTYRNAHFELIGQVFQEHDTSGRFKFGKAECAEKQHTLQNYSLQGEISELMLSSEHVCKN